MNDPGRRWAYFGVILGFSASITANIASTVLTVTPISLFLRVPFAIFWPLATYVAIEVLVRTDWNASWSHRAVRAVLTLPVGSVAAYVSYLHQHHLMILAGEPGMAQLVGPIAVDGMLFGMTARLIVTRVKVTLPDLDGWDEAWDELTITQPDAPVSPAPVQESAPAPAPAPPAPRAPRGKWDAEVIATMAAAGQRHTDETGMGASTYARYSRVGRILERDPQAVINYRKEKVNAEIVSRMRELVRR